MSFSEREELERQREAIATHLRWLDARLAATEAAGAAAAPPPSASTEAGAPGAVVTPSEVDVASVHSEVRRGCLIYGAIATAALLGLAAYVFFAYRGDDPAPKIGLKTGSATSSSTRETAGPKGTLLRGIARETRGADRADGIR